MTDTLLVYAPRNFTLIPNVCRRRSKLMVKVTTARTGRLENTLYEYAEEWRNRNLRKHVGFKGVQ